MPRNQNGKEFSSKFYLYKCEIMNFFRWNKVKLARSSRKNRVQQRKNAFLETVRGGSAE
jgi:hypothetical protein